MPSIAVAGGFARRVAAWTPPRASRDRDVPSGEPDWHEAHARRVGALARAAQEAGRATTTEEADAAFSGAWERHMRLWTEGVATGSREVARDALGTLGLRRPHEELAHLIEAFEEASHTSRIQALPGARDLLAERGYDPTYGARPLKRVIQRMVLDPLAMELLEGRIQEGSVVTLDAGGEQLIFHSHMSQVA